MTRVTRIPVLLHPDQWQLICCDQAIRAQYVGYVYRVQCSMCRRTSDIRRMPGYGVIRRRHPWPS